MIKNPLISCILPAYNASEFLRVAIDSILSQTIKDFELIIINDGSTDETENIIKSYSDERIIYIKNPENLKLIKTLNIGIDHARGKYISRMDSDDQALPTLFEEELKEFQKHPNAGIINTLTNHLREDGCSIRPNRQYFWTSPEVCSVVSFYANMISHPGVMVLSSLMKHYRYNDKTLYLHFEDKELWLRMFMNGVKCYTLHQRLLNYRESETSINAIYGVERTNRIQNYMQTYAQERWGYSWHPLPVLSDFNTFFVHFFSLLKLWHFLYCKKYLKLSELLYIYIWQIHYFSGIGKRLFRFS